MRWSRVHSALDDSCLGISFPRKSFDGMFFCREEKGGNMGLEMPYVVRLFTRG